MTDIRTTQIVAESWNSGSPNMQVTTVLVEQWITVQTQNPQMIVTQAVLEMWASVAEAVTAQQQARAMILA